jgi:hypothetical protein
MDWRRRPSEMILTPGKHSGTAKHTTAPHREARSRQTFALHHVSPATRRRRARTSTYRGCVKTVIWESREGEKDGRKVEDRVRKVDVRRWIVHARVDPTWANSGHPSPLPVPLRSRLSGSSMSGTARVPAPQRKSGAIRRVRESPRCRISASASANLLSTLAQ